jgi:hypothetical protein
MSDLPVPGRGIQLAVVLVLKRQRGILEWGEVIQDRTALPVIGAVGRAALLDLPVDLL